MTETSADYRDGVERTVAHIMCPHGDPTCPCPDEGGQPGACHYEGSDPFFCPNPPPVTNGCTNLTFAHCHVEGCEWHQSTCSQRVSGECGLLKLGAVQPLTEGYDGTPMYSMSQAKPGQIGWACGWLRTPLNVASREELNL